MSTTTEISSTRVPLRLPAASATFLIGIAGYLGVNLSPYMISAVQAGVGLDVLAASWLVTATLLLTAVVGLATARLCAGRRRKLVARAGLALAVLGFLAAGLVPALIIPGLIVGGFGAGGAVSASGAALAAFRNPDRVAGFNGLSNRGVITIVLAVVPALGLTPINVFGSIALIAAIGLALSVWLPAAPTASVNAAASVGEAMPITVPPTGTIRTSPPATRNVTIAGFVLLFAFALWGVSEDSLWAMFGVLSTEQAGLSPELLGLALSSATAGGLLGSFGLMAVGNRLGRAVPLLVLLVAGGALKIAQGYITEPVALVIVFILWNSIYAVAYMYFVSTSAALDADGRWSGPLLAIYLVGSALTPVIGASLVDLLGFQGFTLALGLTSFALAVPVGIVAHLSSRVERASTTRMEHVA